MRNNMFLKLIEEFLRESGMSATVFSKLATGDPTYVATLRRGRETRESTQRRVLEFMENFPHQTAKS